MKLTATQLQLATGCPPHAADRFAPHLLEACERYQINTPLRMAGFLAQIGHESQGLTVFAESLNYSVESLLSTFKDRITPEQAALYGRTATQRADQRAVANIVYGGEWGRVNLGNTEPEDGWLLRGRGPLQITGRYNMTRVRDRLRDVLGPEVPDFVAHPEQLEDPRWAAWAACCWWDARGCTLIADTGDIDALTRRINGGMHGADDRRARYERALSVLSTAAPAPSTESVEAAPSPGRADPAPTYQTEWDRNNPPPSPPESNMPAPLVFLKAALPFLIEGVPRLARLFGSGSEVSERNLKAVEMAAETIKGAVGASTEQEAIEKLRTDPQARAAADQAIADRWFELVEAGGGGIDGARQADAAARQAGDILHSPSFWVTLALLPLVYLVVGSVVGLWGSAWPADVRAAIGTAVVSLIVGGAAGYYWGQTTSRNRTPGAKA